MEKIEKRVEFKNKKEDKEESIEKPSIEEIKKFSETISRIKKEIARVVVGQEEIIDGLIRAILCDGHVLVEGVPGVAKTLSIKALARVTGCKSKRIQFTVDLLPSDIIGITTYNQKEGFGIIKGPIFTNFIIADEINRSPPKTQSALIEAMQEKQVTISRNTFKLDSPFFVMANENPIETAGVYALPEAQIDRFIFKLIVKYPKIDEEDAIMLSNTTLKKFEDFKLRAVTSAAEIIKMQDLTKKVYMSKKIRRYILRITEMTRTKDFIYGEYIEWGASPRASISLFIASKAEALMQGRNFVIPKDVKKVAFDVLRHRLILSYKARAEDIDADKIINEILKKIEAP